MRTDEHLASRAAAGDADACADLYRRHAVVLLTYLRRRSPSAEIAFDLLSETWVAAVAGLGGFDPARGSVRGWLFGIAHNELRAAWRHGQVEDRARRRLALEPIALDDEALRRIDETVDDGALAAALASLSPDERGAIEARVIDELSYDEAAALLRCSPSVVRKRVSRGLARLRSTVEDPR